MSTPYSDIEIVVPNLNRRLSGVTATIVRLLPIQAKRVGIVSFGVGLPDFIPRLSLFQLLMLGYQATKSGRPRIWHARRNIEMALGLVLKHVFRQPYILLFTSASQRHHTAYTKWLISCMDHVIATSSATASYLEVDHTVILHGIPLDDFSPVSNIQQARAEKAIPGEFVIGCFGRIRHQKGTDVFVDAMIEMLPRYPKASAVIMGRATGSHLKFLQDLKDRVSAAGLAERIIFPGEVAVHKIADWYKVLSLFVAPQRWEGFGLTPLEAMASGVPVVATRVGAFSELVKEGETGGLIDAGNIGQMVEAVERYVIDPEKTAAHGRKALEHMRDHFGIEREAEQILAVYTRLQKP